MPKFRIMNADGDTTVEWTRNLDEERMAREFERLSTGGHLAYTPTEEGNVHVRKFDPSAETVVFTPALKGG